MKRKILVLGLFVGCLIALSFTTEKTREVKTNEQEGAAACIGTPSDRNCNGIPDWMEIESGSEI